MLYAPLKVLLVEDMLMIARVTEQMLKKSSAQRYSTTHKTRLADSLAALKAEDFDVILLDLNLPDSRDLDTVARVVEAAPEVPIIVLTASNDDEMGLRAVQLGAQDFLLKGDFNYLTLDRAIMFSIERHRLQRTLRQLAVIDELTGLYNRRGFNTLHPDVIQRVRDTGGHGYLCYFDLDYFKSINDELGHAKGDEALQEFAATLRGVFRRDTLLVRQGGDEFIAMGVESEPGQIHETLQSLAVVLSVRNGKPDIEYPLESSWGVACFGADGPHGIEELGAIADAALYQKKQERHRAAEAAGRAGRYEERRA